MDDFHAVSLAKHPPAHSAINLFTSGGLANISKVWVGTTTTTGGEWSVDYTAAGFADVHIVLPTAQLEETNVFDRGFASLSSEPTLTSASGYGLRGANLLALGSTLRAVPDGTTIHVVALGA